MPTDRRRWVRFRAACAKSVRSSRGFMKPSCRCDGMVETSASDAWQGERLLTPLVRRRRRFIGSTGRRDVAVDGMDRCRASRSRPRVAAPCARALPSEPPRMGCFMDEPESPAARRASADPLATSACYRPTGLLEFRPVLSRRTLAPGRDPSRRSQPHPDGQDSQADLADSVQTRGGMARRSEQPPDG